MRSANLHFLQHFPFRLLQVHSTLSRYFVDFSFTWLVFFCFFHRSPSIAGPDNEWLDFLHGLCSIVGLGLCLTLVLWLQVTTHCTFYYLPRSASPAPALLGLKASGYGDEGMTCSGRRKRRVEGMARG
ncbi:uncharacterized protein B0T15DRAFT_523672 [Chaetomium strumarium]|uniref:Uncharacterized protein n=1 Tax=Chaetomium strumarium TaxID=1170767 RepID=A0AAJ0GXW7_9PEZI|nr:hypothetical protein B0T15DRAFT_523672 [Chaetomium strumarium]